MSNVFTEEWYREAVERVRGGVVGTRTQRSGGLPAFKATVGGKPRQGEQSMICRTNAAGSNPAPSPYKSKLEARYAAHLDMLLKAGEIRSWFYEPFTLKLADDSRYRPDFLVVLPGGLERKPEIHETKGKWTKSRRDSMVRLKWAAQLYGDVFTFRLIEWSGHGFDGRYI